MIKPLLFIRLRVNDRVVKREGRLLGDRFENDKITRGKGPAHRAVANREHAHVLLTVKQRRRHQRGSTERCLPQTRQLGHLRDITQRDWLSRLPDRADQTFTGRHIMRAQKTFQRSRRRRGLM